MKMAQSFKLVLSLLFVVIMVSDVVSFLLPTSTESPDQTSRQATELILPFEDDKRTPRQNEYITALYQRCRWHDTGFQATYPGHSCIPTHIYGYGFLSWLIDGCPDGLNDAFNDAVTKERCERPRVHALATMYPVYSQQNRLNYRNVFCARCHGQLVIQPWTMDVYPDSAHFNQFNSTEFTANPEQYWTHILEIPNTNIFFTSKTSIHCLGYADVVDSCPGQTLNSANNCTANGQFVPVALPQTPRMLFYNPDCLACNYQGPAPSVPEVTCVGKEEMLKLDALQPLPFRIVLNFNRYTCTLDQQYDPKQDACIQRLQLTDRNIDDLEQEHDAIPLIHVEASMIVVALGYIDEKDLDIIVNSYIQLIQQAIPMLDKQWIEQVLGSDSRLLLEPLQFQIDNYSKVGFTNESTTCIKIDGNITALSTNMSRNSAPFMTSLIARVASFSWTIELGDVSATGFNYAQSESLQTKYDCSAILSNIRKSISKMFDNSTTGEECKWRDIRDQEVNLIDKNKVINKNKFESNLSDVIGDEKPDAVLNARYSGKMCIPSGRAERKSADTWLLFEAPGIVTYVCMSVSCVSLILFILVYCLVPSARTFASVLTMNLAICLLLAQLLFMAGVELQDFPTVCLVVAVVLHYIWLAAIFWMNVSAFHMFRMFRNISTAVSASRGDQHYALIPYLMYAYLTPALIIASCVLLHLYYYSQTVYAGGYCFITHTHVLAFAFALPVGFVIMTNVAFLGKSAITIRYLSSGSSTYSVSDRSNVALYAKLSGALGLTWIAGFAGTLSQLVVLWYVFDVLNSLQGLVIFITYGLKKGLLQNLKTKCARTSVQQANTADMGDVG